jgi:hypothetical protein
MRIIIDKGGRRLEDISIGDILVFKEREESVIGIDANERTLYCKRKVEAGNVVGEEHVRYSNAEKIFQESNGEVYNSVKKLKCLIL